MILSLVHGIHAEREDPTPRIPLGAETTQASRRGIRVVRRRRQLHGKTITDIVRYRLAVDPHSAKRLAGPLKGYYSARLSYQDRILYSIQDDELVVIVVCARTHYGD
ncbi:type II toxin-antitoxin system RelE family toxin [Thiocapsa rosea]|uniref:Txe/YoeB family toxin of Txe-Axe toxin-antitoxin module n=1 Tax=Thiocapsa rosea TaxID=69360 RepID=A0A495VC71_9GAMM|nr:type II toxin-antitoxin system YoeB family toxin [Thiocapsa rosea]RKT46380.1 Txe/YoeB family toxin of Txe-Axe toxin-antitoxin module [Thiocapsa rosea]